MADAYEKDLAQKSSFTKQDYVRVVGSDNVSYKQIATAVAKTLIDYGMDVVNSATNLVSGDDLNNFKTAGVYRSSGSSVSSGIVNTPLTSGGYVLYVVQISSVFTFQLAVGAISPTVTFKRIYNNNNSTWSAWEKTPTRAEVDALYTPTVHTMTFGDKNWQFRKLGKLVVVNAYGDIKSASAGTNTVGTLPTEYRPAYQVILGIANDTAKRFLSISTAGVVNFYTPTAISTATNCGIGGCYITN